MRAISSSRAVRPARPSTTNTTRSASSMAAITWSRTAAIRFDSVAGSKPPVSTTVACQRSKVAVPYRRSRVTPGTSWTMERRRPTRRLKRGDLPTLGRPTSTMMGRIMGSSARSAAEEGGDEGSWRRLHGAHGNPEAAAHVLEGEVVEEDAGLLAQGNLGHEDLVAERAAHELRLDVLAGEQACHPDPVAEPVVGHRRHGDHEVRRAHRLEERAQAWGEQGARHHRHVTRPREPPGEVAASCGEAVGEPPHEAHAVLDDGETLVGRGGGQRQARVEVDLVRSPHEARAQRAQELTLPALDGGDEPARLLRGVS